MLHDVSDDSVGMLYIFFAWVVLSTVIGRTLYKGILGQFVELG